MAGQDHCHRPPLRMGSPQLNHSSEGMELSDMGRPVKAVPRKDDLRPGVLHEGDAVRVFSRSANAWVDAKVAKLVEASSVRVEYEVKGYWCGKTLHPDRLAIPAASPDLFARDEVEVCDPAASRPDPMLQGNRLEKSPTKSCQLQTSIHLDPCPVAAKIDARMTLADFFTEREKKHGVQPSPPPGYEFCKVRLWEEQTGGLGMPAYMPAYRYLFSNDDQCEVFFEPLKITSNLEDCMVLFHYTGRNSGAKVYQSRELWATILETCVNPHDTCFGDGVYATKLAPDQFRSKDCILRNNYNYTGKEFHGRADICIPLLVSRSMVHNIMCDAIPNLYMKWNTTYNRAPQQGDLESDLGEVLHRAGFNRQGKAIDPKRDIWVISRMDRLGYVEHAIDDFDALTRQLESADSQSRAEAFRSMAKQCKSHQNRVVMLMKRHLANHRDDVVTFEAAIESLVQLAPQDPACTPALLHLLELYRSESGGDLTFQGISDLLCKVTLSEHAEVVQALLRFLDDGCWFLLDYREVLSIFTTLGCIANQSDDEVIEKLVGWFEGDKVENLDIALSAIETVWKLSPRDDRVTDAICSCLQRAWKEMNEAMCEDVDDVKDVLRIMAIVVAPGSEKATRAVKTVLSHCGADSQYVYGANHEEVVDNLVQALVEVSGIMHDDTHEERVLKALRSLLRRNLDGNTKCAISAIKGLASVGRYDIEVEWLLRDVCEQPFSYESELTEVARNLLVEWDLVQEEEDDDEEEEEDDDDDDLDQEEKDTAQSNSSNSHEMTASSSS